MSNGGELYVNHSGVLTRLQAVADGVIRVTHTARDHFLDQPTPMVVYDGRMDAEMEETEEELRLCAGSVTAVIAKATGAIRFLDAEGRLLLREPNRRPHLLQEKPVYLTRFDENAAIREEKSVDGARASASPAETYLDHMAYEGQQRFVFAEDEALYGLGSHEEGYGNLRGRSRILYQHNMKACVPVLASTRGWGILFNMGCLMAFHDDHLSSYLWADCADELDWYFMAGDGSYGDVMRRYRLLTGEAPMLPRYALGYIQSRERYVDGAEMVAVAREYRRRNVPLDMIVLDWQSWPEGQWGYKVMDEKRFPNDGEFLAQLHQMDVKAMVSIWPSMQGDQNENRKEMLARGLMLGNKTIYDAFNPEARRVYWRQAREGLFDKGFDAWWCDCSEPFENDWKGCIRPEPFRRVALNADEAKKYLNPTQLNVYSLYHSQGIYEGQRSVTDEKRVLNLTRSSYAGQHRYATVTWSGDVSANWETLRRHVPEGLNFCATGEPYWSTDIGGFFVSNNQRAWFLDGDYAEGARDPAYRELFTRWAQYAACLPMMRAHGSQTPREIWRFGEPGEPFYDAIEKAIRLRYHLVPFLYSLMYETNRTGVPMLRVPALVFPEDSALRQIEDEMMLGDCLLVKPVTRPMLYNAEAEREAVPNDVERVYLPAGHQWHDLNTGDVYPGGQWVQVHAPLDVIPMFVRGGTILPWAKVEQSTAAMKREDVEIRVFPGEDGSFTLYEDAGDGYGYEQGQYSLTVYRWDDKVQQLTKE